MFDFSKSTFVKNKRAKWLDFKYPNCVRLTCNKPRYKTLRMISVNREDKIKFVKNGMSKESLDYILQSLETHREDICNVRFIVYGNY